MHARIVFCVLVLAAFLSCTACSGKKDEAGVFHRSDATQEQSVPSASSEAFPGGNAQARANELEALVDLIVAEANELPRAEFDPGALAAKLGNSPDAHFEWVRDHTLWVPYRGLLRGSTGVLLDRVGSSLDRAVLLGDLLRRTGHTVRLAHAELTEERARELLGRVRPIPDRRETSVASRTISAERQRAIEAIWPSFGEDLEERVAETRRRVAAAEALVNSQTEALLAVVRPAIAAREIGDDAAVAALRDHWWVERKVEGKWVAMDPLLPASQVGESYAATSAVAEWQASESFPSIRESDWHAVDVRIVVERYEAGEVSEAVVLEQTLKPAVVLGRPLRLLHLPVPWPESPPDPDRDPQAFRSAALGVKLWVPVLEIGDDQIIQSGFTEDGDVKTELVESVEATFGAAGTEVVSGMDMALGGFDSGGAEPAATAEWLDYEVRVPGVGTHKLRRQVFDLLGPARRSSRASDFDGSAELRKLERFETLLSQTDILIQPCNLTSDYVAHLTTAGVVANQKALKEFARLRSAAEAASLSSDVLRKISIWGPLPNLALWRMALGNRSADWYIDRPNVLNHRISRKVVNADGTTYLQLMDVASNEVAAHVRDRNKQFAIRLRQGVADTVAEMASLGTDFDSAENTASVFGRLAAENSRGMLINAQDSSAVRELPWPPDELARAAADVEAGYMVVVPRRAIAIDNVEHVAWWKVHPASGDTIGVMDTGFHADTAEYNAARAQQGRLFNWLYEKDRYRDWQTLKLMAEGRLPMTAEQAYNLRLFNLTQRVIENIQFFVL